MKGIMTTRTLKTTLSILCSVSLLSGCVITPEVSVDAPPNKPQMERLSSGEQFQSPIPVQPAVQRISGEKAQSNTADPSMQQLQLMYLKYLKKEGYLPEIDSDGDVLFKKEGNSYFIDVRGQQKDPSYFRIILPGIFRIDNKTERLMVLIAADHVNSTVKVVKFYTVENHTWAAVEIFISKTEDFKDIFPRLMSTLSGGLELFAKKMKELRSQKI